MGLAPYGQPRYASILRDQLVDVLDDGSFRLNTDLLGFLDSPTMTNFQFEELFGGPARAPDMLITQRERDLSASVQQVAEDIVLKLVKQSMKLAGHKSLVMAGGVALNCVANGRVWREAGLDGMFVQPAAGDAGGALGAALLVAHQKYGSPRSPNLGGDALKGSFLGPAYSTHEVLAVLDRLDAPSHLVLDPDERAGAIADALADGLVVGFFNGRMEFGPRALGARSILGDPRRPEMQSRMNLKIKFRESFRPFAPAVLAEHAAEYFDLKGDSPYMLLVAPVRNEHRFPTDSPLIVEDDMLTHLDQVRSDIPAVTYIDFSARVQTVGRD